MKIKIHYIHIISLTLFIILAILLYSFSWFKVSLTSAIENIYAEYLEESSNQYNAAFNIKLNSYINTLEALAKSFKDVDFDDYSVLRQTINYTKNYNDFKRISVAMPSGLSLNNNNTTGGNISKNEYFIAAINGRSNISETTHTDIDGEKVLVIAVPVYDEENNIKGVLTGTFNKSFLNEIFSVNTFKGNSYSYLIESDGDVILKTYSPYAAFTDGNFFDFLSRANLEGDDTLESVKNDFKNNSKKVIKYNINSEGRICLYRPTGLHGWFIVTIMPINIITAEIKSISFDIFILLMAMFVSYISMSLAIFLILRRADKLKIKNDSLKYKNDKYKMIHEQSQLIVFDYDIEEERLELTGNIDFVFGIPETNMTITKTEPLFKQIHSDDSHVLRNIREMIKNRDSYFTSEFRIRCSDEEYYWFKFTAALTKDETGKPMCLTGSLVDVNDQKVTGKWTKDNYERDNLTNLFDKESVCEKVMRFIQEIPGRNIYAIFIIDLDNFNQINDNLGHAFGDHVLIEVSQKITSIFSQRDIIGRLDGDKFMVFLNIADKSQDEALKITSLKAQFLCETLKESYVCPERIVDITASIGISIFPIHGKDYNTLYEKAEIALETVKKNGKNSYCIFGN